MCTILTINTEFWMVNKTEVVEQILSDSTWNSDGFVLICMDIETPALDMTLSTMRIPKVIDAITSFFSTASVKGRIFLHCRAATTQYVGIAYNHLFSDFKGTFVMHNGIIDNPARLAVDSFNLLDYSLNNAKATLDDLIYMGEDYANLFLVHTDSGKYSIVRLKTGSLFTDLDGNYSSNRLGEINNPVAVNSYADHGDIAKKIDYRTHADYWDSFYDETPSYKTYLGAGKKIS